MVTPIGNNVNAFDATTVYTFAFISNGGNQVVSNTINIYNATSSAVVYTNTVTSNLWQHTVPANTLTNGTQYYYTITTTDINSVSSSASSAVSFYCYSAPTLVFSNLSSGATITSANYTFKMTYSQAQSELMNYCVLTLTDANDNVVGVSSNLYSTSLLGYTFYGLTNNTTYKARCVGTTVNNTVIDTGYVSFSVAYTAPSYASLSAVGVCDSGYVRFSGTITSTSTITSLNIKRRKSNTMDWVWLASIPVSTTADLTFSYDDYYVPSGVSFDYAVVPIIDNNETDYLTASVTPTWRGVFISNKQASYKLFVGVDISSLSNNKDSAATKTLGAAYPIVISNSMTDYTSGTTEAMFMGSDFPNTRQLNKFGVTSEVSEISQFLRDGTSKILKDWNGNIYLIQIVGNVTPTYDISTGVQHLSFNWVEQGKYDNENDLMNNDLLDY